MLFNSPKRIKRSVDMSEETDYFVDRYRDLLSKLGTTVSRGAVIDSVLPSLLSLNPKQAVKLSQIVEREGKLSQSLYESTPESEELARNELSKEVETWARLKSILDVLSDGLTPIQPMVKIPMAGDMSILVPDDPRNWIVANPMDAPFADEATIVEVRNGKIYGVPHFVVFHSGDVSAEVIDEIVTRAFPKFEAILNKRVDPTTTLRAISSISPNGTHLPRLVVSPPCLITPFLAIPMGLRLSTRAVRGRRISPL